MKMVNKLCVPVGFILFLKNILAIPHGFIKIFHLQQSRYLTFSMVQQNLSILHSPWCNKTYRTYQELGKDDFYSFDQEKVPFILIYLLRTCKNRTYLIFVYSICQRVEI